MYPVSPVTGHLDTDSLGFPLLSSRCYVGSQVRAANPCFSFSLPPDLNSSNLSQIPRKPQNCLYILCIPLLNRKSKFGNLLTKWRFFSPQVNLISHLPFFYVLPLSFFLPCFKKLRAKIRRLPELCIGLLLGEKFNIYNIFRMWSFKRISIKSRILYCSSILCTY